jgi:hypothetical protein
MACGMQRSKLVGLFLLAALDSLVWLVLSAAAWTRVWVFLMTFEPRFGGL